MCTHSFEVHNDLYELEIAQSTLKNWFLMIFKNLKNMSLIGTSHQNMMRFISSIITRIVNVTRYGGDFLASVARHV